MATLKSCLVLVYLFVFCFTIILCDGLPKAPRNDSESESEESVEEEEERILNGNIATPRSYPYMVSLQEKMPATIKFCGGVIIQSRWILTASHCFGDFGENDLHVKAGVTEAYSNGPTAQYIRVKKIILHPHYNSFGELENDIALLLLESPLKYNKYVKPISLPPKNYTARGDGTIVGWGAIDKAEKIQSKVLRYATLPVSKRKHCRKYFDGITKNQLCLGYKTKQNACAGDSGGPYVQPIKGKPTVVGITSFGTAGCHENDPIVYTNVASYLDFIKNTIKENTENNIKPITLNNTNMEIVKEYPYLAAIMEFNAEDNIYEKLCAGVIIEKQFVLTTADCFDNRVYGFIENIRVKIGTNEIDNPNKGELLEVENIRRHRYYRINDSKMKHNLAVMHLKKPLKLSENVTQQVSLPPSNYDLKSINGTIIGWNLNNSTQSYNLVISNIENGNDTTCKQLYPDANDSEICVQQTNNVCIEESGSPLIVKTDNGTFVIGLNSIFNRNCENNQPFLVASVVHYNNFINDTMDIFTN